MGIWFFVTIAAGLSSFGVQKNPAAPSPAEVMKYAPADADLMIHVDLKAVVPKNYQALSELPRDPIAAELDFADQLDVAMRQAAGARGMVKGITGLDFIEDPSSATAWIKFVSSGEPEVIFVVRGSFPADAITKLATMSGGGVNVGGHIALQPEPGIVIAQVDGGTFIGGTRSLVEPRLAKGYKPSSPRGAAAITQLLQKKPFAALASTPSKQAIATYSRETGIDNVLIDVLEGHEFGALALLHNGVYWTFRSRGKEGYERGLAASGAVIDLMRASQLGARGAAHLVLAALPSYASRPWAKKLLAHRELLEELIAAYVGDGDLKAKLVPKANKKAVEVTLIGDAFSHVMPVMVLGALAGVGMYANKGLALGPRAPGPPGSPVEGRAAAIARPAGPSSLDLQRAWDIAAGRRRSPPQ